MHENSFFNVLKIIPLIYTSFFFQEWGMNLSHKFLGGYRLETDQTWTPLDRIGEVDEKKQITKKLIQTSNFGETFRAIASSDNTMDSS